MEGHVRGFWAGPIMFGPDGPVVMVLYSIIPWVGVMAAGMLSAPILTRPPCSATGRVWSSVSSPRCCSCSCADPISMAIPTHGRRTRRARVALPFPRALISQHHQISRVTVLSLEDTGADDRVDPTAQRTKGGYRPPFDVRSRSVLFHVLHIPLIHVLALIVAQVRFGHVTSWLFANHPMAAGPPPEGYVWSLGLLYSIWALTVMLLYFACRWYDKLKRTVAIPATLLLGAQ